jgi:DNA helicase-2/ATP-dependent DNA helicase PcrA
VPLEVLSHPDYPQENAFLEEILRFVAEEKDRATVQEKELRDWIEDFLRHNGGIFNNDLFINQTRHRHTQQELINLRLAQNTPYFTRVDFQERGADHPSRYYIGKWGIYDPTTQTPKVVDWRSPIANLYYSGQVGPLSYQAPDGAVEGELLLKRHLGIERGVLTSIFDTEVVARDAYLQSVLGSHAGSRLKDIVSTIQREQNDIIRAKVRNPVVVQGVAGSGKTTIALHRIAYLLYTYQDTMHPENMMILAPNPLFLHYISAVLPELGVENALQTTFYGLCARLAGKLPALEDQSLAQLIALDEPGRAQVTAIGRFKGSLAFGQCVRSYLDRMERQLVPRRHLAVGPVKICTYEEMRRIFLEELKPFPLARRQKELKKYMKTRVKRAQAQVAQVLTREFDKRLAILKARMEDSPERQSKIRAMYQSRDERIAQAQAAVQPQVDAYLKAWTLPDLIALYQGLFTSPPPFDTPEDWNEGLWEQVCAHSLEVLARKRIEQEDVAPLLMLCQLLTGYQEKLDIHHVVVDEAQDLSPLQFQLLHQLTGTASFTIVGDLSQGIHANRGLASWRELDGVFPRNPPEYLQLVTSYRNTVEIMSCARQVDAVFPTGNALARPVLRHGPRPSFHQVAPRQLTERIAAVTRGWLADGLKTVAVIAKTREPLKGLQGKLTKLGIPCRILSDTDADYTDGVMLVPATLAKGLEFDGVILADVDAETFGLSALDARLLYVCMTRPLHRLEGYYAQQLSPLINPNFPLFDENAD